MSGNALTQRILYQAQTVRYWQQLSINQSNDRCQSTEWSINQL